MEENRERLILRKDSIVEPSEIQKALIDYFTESQRLIEESIRTFPKDLIDSTKEIDDKYKWKIH